MEHEKFIDTPRGRAKTALAGPAKKKYKSRKHVPKPRKLRRACDECTRSKVKCNGQAPCQLCVKRDCPCIYRPRLRRNSKKKLLLQQKKLARQHMSARIGNDLLDIVSIAGTKSKGLKGKRQSVKFTDAIIKHEVKVDVKGCEEGMLQAQSLDRPVVHSAGRRDTSEFDFLAEMLVSPDKDYSGVGAAESREMEEQGVTHCFKRETIRENEDETFLFNDSLFDSILTKDEKGNRPESARYQETPHTPLSFPAFDVGNATFEHQTLYVP